MSLSTDRGFHAEHEDLVEQRDLVVPKSLWKHGRFPTAPAIACTGGMSGRSSCSTSSEHLT